MSRFETNFNAYAIPILDRFFGVEVTVSNGAVSTDPFTARRNSIAPMGAASRTTSHQREYLLPKASVVLNGNLAEPKAGWRLTEGTEVYEIQPPNKDKPAVEEPSGNYDWLVHVKRVQ